MPKIKVKGQTV